MPRLGSQHLTKRFCSSGDGALTGKHKTFTNFGITLIDEGDSSKKKPLVIGIGEMKENYENISSRVQDINRQVTDIEREGVVIDGRVQLFEFYLGGDYKFLLTILGFNAANANFACVFCLAPKTGRHLATHKRRQSINVRDPGVVRPNLLPAVPLDRVAIDTLHMHLRVTDKLFSCVFEKISADKREHFASVMRESVRIRGKLKVEKDKLETSNLSALDRDNIIRALITTDILAECVESADVATLLKELLSQYVVLRDMNRGTAETRELDRAGKVFMDKFLALFQAKMVTPYIHLMCVHVPELVERIGKLAAFSQQADEKLNHEIAAGYFRCSNFSDGPRQVMQRQWRKTQYRAE